MKWAMAIVLGLAAAGCRRPDSKRPSAQELAAGAEGAQAEDGRVVSIPGFRPAQGGRPAILIIETTEPEFASAGPTDAPETLEVDAELQTFIQRAAMQEPFDEPLEIPAHLIERK